MGLLKRIFERKKELNTRQKENLRKLNRICGNPGHLNREKVKEYHLETKRLENQGFNVKPHNYISESYYRIAFKK